MKADSATFLTRIDQLTTLAESGPQSRTTAFELMQGCTSLVTLIHGGASPQIVALTKAFEPLIAVGLETGTDVGVALELARGALNSLRAEVLAGLTGSLAQSVAGEILGNFLGLAKVALAEARPESKNVAAVLAAAAFEDAMRRLASRRNLPHQDKLANTITDLKTAGALAGAQVTIAQSYLKFRNDALHADWSSIDSAGTASCIAFVEQILVLHFS